MLAALGDVVAALGVDGTDQDVLRRADRAWAAADAWVKSYCGWALEAGDFVEFFDGGRDKIVLGQWRVSATSGVSAADPAVEYGVWVDPLRVFGADTKLADADFRLTTNGTSGILRRLSASGFGGWCWGGWGGSRCSGTEVVRVSYRAGYEEPDIPDDLADAAVQVAARLYEQEVTRQQVVSAGGGQIKSIRSGDGQISYMTPAESMTSSGSSGRSGDDPYGVRDVLDLYREVYVG